MPSLAQSPSSGTQDLLGLINVSNDFIGVPDSVLDKIAIARNSADMSIERQEQERLSPSTPTQAASPGSPSNRLSISSLINSEHKASQTLPSSLAETLGPVRASTPITVDSALSPFTLEDSNPEACASPDYSNLWNTDDPEITASMGEIVRSRQRNGYATAVPLAHPPRAYKDQRIRRPSSRILQSRQAEDIKEAYLAEDASRRQAMRDIWENHQIMKRQEQEQREKLKRTRDSDDEHSDDNSHEQMDRGERKRLKLEQQSRLEGKEDNQKSLPGDGAERDKNKDDSSRQVADTHKESSVDPL